jgi:hypothetical protein
MPPPPVRDWSDKRLKEGFKSPLGPSVPPHPNMNLPDGVGSLPLDTSANQQSSATKEKKRRHIKPKADEAEKKQPVAETKASEASATTPVSAQPGRMEEFVSRSMRMWSPIEHHLRNGQSLPPYVTSSSKHQKPARFTTPAEAAAIGMSMGALSLAGQQPGSQSGKGGSGGGKGRAMDSEHRTPQILQLVTERNLAKTSARKSVRFAGNQTSRCAGWTEHDSLVCATRRPHLMRFSDDDE